MIRPNPPAPDPWRKARFREEARDIVAKDRYDRKYGRAVDTAGAIARALERAYKLGHADAQNGPADSAPEISPDGPIEWALIPPRPRNAFWSCCLFMFGRTGDKARRGHLEPDMTERGTMGWRLVVEGLPPEKVIGQNSIRPLVQLGLIDRDPDIQEYLTVSERGRATWERFLAEGGHYPEDLTSF